LTKLQRQKAYTYTTEKGKKIDHYKHTIVLPEDVVSETGWKEGTDLEVEVENGMVILRKPERATK
jgi:bifunctional DNA-binding transcriptional regulator/antitoxin component of YhaV-PrlF toxin-antitoxin module